MLPLSILIPTLNAGRTLAVTLGALALRGEEVVVADGGSIDGTEDLARRHGAGVVAAPRGRGPQLAAAVAASGQPWLLLLHADTRLDTGWREAVRAFISAPSNAGRAGYFRFALDDHSPAARRLERAVAWRCRVLSLPYGDQGLLIRRERLEELGGIPLLPIMEDVELVRRLVRAGGRRALVALDVPALTSAERWRREGYLRRSARNLACLGLWRAGLPAGVIRKLYG